MYINNTYLNKLEYNKILELLSNYSITYLGKDLCSRLLPSNNKDKVSKLLKETQEAQNITLRKGNIPLIPIANVDIEVKKLESLNTLSIKGLLDIGNILKLSQELKDFFFKDDNIDIEEFSILNNYFSNLYTNKKIEKQILDSIVDENEISDKASPTLLSLRKTKKKLEDDIKLTLNNMVHSPSYSKYIMESIVTIRNDRYVIPVKEEFRSKIKGFIHDISSSGSTVFIEPISVFEMNNKIAQLKIEESIEIEKILQKLSSLLFDIADQIKNNIQLVGLLDFIFAKAKFANSLDGNMPIINDNKYINLKGARHPLINNDDVVPIDIQIGDKYRSLIITGPNTGGKTVSLKTVGLLCLMACSGLFIPAKEDSSIYVFDNIFADIGDEQSIQESLSTFSSHMLNTINILNNITDKSLVLLDELGSGTDPVEGANLAMAILEYLYNKNVLTIATTHYQEIKQYALVTDGFENASSEFDIESLKPTYKLLIGIPGKSNAFEISRRLGLNEDILNKAKSNLNKEDISFEEVLKSIYDDKIQIENEKEEIEKNLNQIELLRKSLETKKLSKESNENKIIQKAQKEAKDIVINAKDDVNYAIKELEEILNKWKELDNADINTLSDSDIVSIVRDISNGSIKKANKIRKDLNNLLSNTKNNTGDSNNKDNIFTTINKSDLKVGTKVKLNNLDNIATIISINKKNNQIQVQVGNIKLNNSIDNIIEIINESNNNTNSSNNNITYNTKQFAKSSIQKSKTISTEINVIGQNVDEACFVIDKYLDDAYLSKLQNISIIHGKGTGKLRKGIHEFLKTHPHVKSYRLGTFGEGEMGVTIVEIK